MNGIITTKEQLVSALTELLPDALRKAQKARPEKLHTISQTAQKLGKNRETIRRMVRQNRIQATADKRYISQAAIDNYLNLHPKK